MDTNPNTTDTDKPTCRQCQCSDCRNKKVKKGKFIMPLAILISGAFVAGAILYTGSNGDSNAQAETQVGNDKIQLAEITKDDHILGDPKAPIKIVEYSDIECPFCKRFHFTMKQIINEYNGQVAWVYRHFPLDNLHAKARREAEATECVAHLGGEKAFWAFTDKLFEITPSNDGLDLGSLPQIAASFGVDEGAFNECLNSGQFSEKVERQYQEAITAGGQGTPYSVIVTEDGELIPIPGALPFESIKGFLDQELDITTAHN